MAETPPPSPGRSHLLRLIARLLVILAVLALLAWVLWRAWGDVRAVDWRGLRLVPGLLVPAVLLPVLAFAVQGLSWVVMMRGLGYRLGWAAGVRAYGLSLLGGYVPGKFLIMVIRAQVARQQGLPGLPVAGSVVLETLLRTMVGGTLAMAGLYWMGLGRAYLGGLLVLIVLSAAVAHPRVFHAAADYLLRRLGREPLPRRLRPADLALLMLGYLLFWALYSAGFCCLAWGVMASQVGGAAGLVMSFIISQISSNLAVFAPVGLGVSDAALAEVLRLAGAATATGVLALVARIWRTVCELLTVGLAWLAGRCSRCH